MKFLGISALLFLFCIVFINDGYKRKGEECMKCFKCNGELSPITKGGIAYAQCGKCGALFTAQDLRDRLAQIQQQKQKQR